MAFFKIWKQQLLGDENRIAVVLASGFELQRAAHDVAGGPVAAQLGTVPSLWVQ